MAARMSVAGAYRSPIVRNQVVSITTRRGPDDDTG
jgi:hypothetical protein